MQVLGSLLKLPEGTDDLPLPWWHRAPLGLMDGTSVFITLTHTTKRPVGDLLVSVLDAAKWENMLTIDGDEDDQPGVLEKAFGAVLPLNIAIAETVTVEPGDKHHVTLVCEPFGDSAVSKDRASATLRNRGLKGLRVRSFLQTTIPQVWGDVGQVNHGWLMATQWRQALQSKYPEGINDVDLSRVVVSADTEKRILRYVFPKKGAFTIRVEHADKPGVLRAICEPLREHKVNILSALLRRGGAKQKTAVLMAICEPTQKAGGRTIEKLRSRLEDLGFEYRVNAKVYEADRAADKIYPRHPDEAVTRIPSPIEPYVRRDQAQLRGKIGIFFSRRFISGERTEKIVQRVREIIERKGCVVVEAQPETDPFATSLLEVTSKLWVSRAGIVLVTTPDSKQQRALSLNLAHEAGFIQGQAKPLLMLVEDGTGKDVDEWANVKGMVFAEFPKDASAFNPDHKNSLDRLVSSWLEKQVLPTRQDLSYDEDYFNPS